MISLVNNVQAFFKNYYFVTARLLAGLVLILIGCICVVGYVREYSWLLAVISCLIVVVGIGIIQEIKLALRAGRVIYGVLSLAIFSMLFLPHPPGDTANRSTAKLVSQVALATFGVVCFPALRSKKG